MNEAHTKEILLKPSTTVGLREKLSWGIFDLGNVSFSIVLVDLVFSLYFVQIVCARRTDGTFLLGMAAFFTQIFVAIFLPFIGALSDCLAKRKFLLGFFFVICILATALLGTTHEGDVWKSLLCYSVANISFSFTENIFSSFLPELIPPSSVGRFSGWTRAFGNVGGIFSLLLVYPLLSPGFTVSNTELLRLCFPIVAAIYMMCGFPLFFNLELQKKSTPTKSFAQALLKILTDLKETALLIAHNKPLLLYFAASFLFFSAATILMIILAVYAQMEYGITGAQQVGIFLLIQAGGTLGSFIFGFFQDKLGSRRSLQLDLLLWIGCVSSLVFAETKTSFYVASFLIGIGNGSLLSLARAVMSLLSDEDKIGKHFGLWGLICRIATGIGPLSFSYLFIATNSFKTPMLLPLCYFIGSLILVSFLPKDKLKKPTSSL
ncbi:MFS transporter permease [Methylacidiphilum kamchatkense Kam1]|uniref:MFS transporter permease n=1 Tax=Methylacidiphilum kamchatkense Kam1 TaxID=1202785 RepID=A0A0C1UQJ7_9BACT|nr:MFS transporter [Methylacidiphilum kamchatkense]KIE58128.1 MFS transporter permease [Methylacidiphilum kamchatkense Kam1]QDQ41542.1 UMF1 family MFS transporter [Methylacidiphilum kamchatkense Kam1]